MSFDPFRRAVGLPLSIYLAVLVAPGARAADEFPVSAAQLKALGVQLQRLAPSADSSGLAYPAKVVLPPRGELVVSAPVGGVIEQLLVSENDSVKPGQPLLRLTSPELGELQLKLMEAASRARLSGKALTREKQLFGEGIIAERRVLEAESAASEDQARRNQAEAALRLAGLDDASIKRIADGGKVDSSIVLRSRLAGVVIDLDVKPGQRVQTTETLMRVADTRQLWLEVELPAALRAELASAKGSAVTVPGRDVSAKVASVASTVSDSQTVMLRADVTQGSDKLHPGEFVQARLTTAGPANSFSLPIQAVARQGDKAYVFVRTATGFVARPVTVLASAGQAVRVQGAELQAGQDVAISSVIALKAAWQGKGGGE